MIRKFVRILGVTLSLAAGLALSEPVALADALTLTSVGQGNTMGGVYTSPYVITVNGTSTLLLACDDFTTDINIGTEWQADKINLDQVAVGGPQKFHDSDVTVPTADGISTTDATYSIGAKYNAAGWLAEQLIANSFNTTNARLAGQYSFAIWQIFYSGAINGYNGQSLSDADKKEVGSLMTQAFAQSGPLQHSVYLYTPNPLISSQEFIGIESVPEASSTAFLAFNFLALPCFLFLVRRRFLGASQ